MPRRRAPLRGSSTLRRNRTLLQQSALRKAKGTRARPDEPLADWCEAAIDGVCTGRAEHRHHVLLRSAGGGDEAANTLDVCSADHRYIHDHPTQAYVAGWLKRRPT